MTTSLPVVERFHSIQGEGAHSGRSAFFIRLAKCKVGCSWCDTKESWSETSHPKIKVNELAKEAAKAHSRGAAFLVITGGEPLHHNLNPLCKALESELSFFNKGNMPIHLETSGVDTISGSPDWITLSPKRHFPPKKELLEACHEIKVVIHSKKDIYFAEQMAKLATDTKKNASKCKSKILMEPILFLQPGWKHKEGKALAIDHVINNPKWRLSLQTHKWLNLD
ncbi:MULTISPECIES: 7-carboxy-7-deazaguanine synthase QueE [Prochlorococcus]|uniref:7-carboxy-7-deazaguanine synthase QueE n=1 Tax=Prochlorococcus TaxID=1218 RepID=UPI0005337035|nr:MULTISPECIES: radical SAM protein [Prochlorococcus]KGG13725.1 Queuosine Biosynthesis QueE Radical SAM [Prochlorococcus sp. MIT 0601]